jgi:hypothetical protein
MHWGWWILIVALILALGLGLGLGFGLKKQHKNPSSTSRTKTSTMPKPSGSTLCNACSDPSGGCITITNLVTPSETCPNQESITIFAKNDNSCGLVIAVTYETSIVLPLSAVTQGSSIAFGVQENSWYWVEDTPEPSTGSERQNPDNCGADISIADDGTVTVSPGVQISGTPDGSKVLTATGSKSGSDYNVTFYRKDNQTLFPTKDCCSPENVGGTCLSKGINPYENSESP